MPNISSIVYSPRPHIFPAEQSNTPEMMPSSVFLPHTTRHTQVPGISAQDHAFYQVVGAIFLLKYTGIKELIVERYREDRPSTECTVGIFHFPSPGQLEAAEHLFRQLSRLELNISFHQDAGISGLSVALQLTNLTQLLESAQDLQHLALHISEQKTLSLRTMRHSLVDGRHMLRPIRFSTTWSNLQSLSLEGTYAHGQDWIQIFQRHTATLKAVKFRDCVLVSGSWAGVVNEIIFSSDVQSLLLDRVRDPNIPHTSGDPEVWRYEGRLSVSDTGERIFVCLSVRTRC
jgi:hypothetical protein